MTAPSLTLAHRYVLNERIAGGGMATVWLARDDVLARPVAVKILHPQLAADEGFVERFRREALSAARLSHPHIVSIYDTGSETHEGDGVERHFIVMELCGGGTLSDMIESEGPLSPDEAAHVAATVCDALAYAHGHGIIHRDIKPQNVLLTDQRTLKVADFGIAKAAFSKSDITTTGEILGTVTYLSPEQVLGQEPGPRSDLYSVGVLLHEMLTGKPPFQADTQIATAMAHARNDPPPVRSLRAGIPKGIEHIVLRALAKDPEDRFPSAEAMAAALRGSPDSSSTAVLSSSALAAETAGRRRDPAASPGGGRSLRWLVPTLLLIALAVAGAFLLPGMLEDEPATNAGPRKTEAPAATALDIQKAEAFDSLPDETEHPEEAAAAIDGDTASTWSTETYDTPMHEFKEGVGLVLDLGEAAEVTSFRLQSPTPGYDVRILTSAEGGTALTDFTEVTEASGVEDPGEVEIEPPARARFWLVLLTKLPGDGSGSAEISEVKIFGS